MPLSSERPSIPAAPVAPTAPVRPVEPVEPVGPVAPTAPVKRVPGSGHPVADRGPNSVDVAMSRKKSPNAPTDTGGTPVPLSTEWPATPAGPAGPAGPGVGAAEPPASCVPGVGHAPAVFGP